MTTSESNFGYENMSICVLTCEVLFRYGDFLVLEGRVEEVHTHSHLDLFAINLQRHHCHMIMLEISNHSSEHIIFFLHIGR